MALNNVKRKLLSEFTIIGFGATVILLLSISAYYITQKTQQSGFSSFQSVIQQNLTSQYLLLTMSNSIRDRILTVHDINLSDDPFVIDEYSLKLQANATEFVKARNQLVNLNLPQNQLDQLEKLKSTLNLVRNNLEKVVVAKTNDNSTIFHNELLAARTANDSVLFEIKALIDIQLNNAQNNLKRVKDANDHAKFIIDIINLLTLGFSLLIIAYIVKVLKTRKTQLNQAIDDLASHNKNLETTVTQRTSDLMTLQKEHSRVNAEIEINRQLQKFISPTHQELKNIKHLDIATYVETAEEVGGDYVDVLPFQEGQLICIGDVTDHGLKSSIIMLMTQSIIRHQSNNKSENLIQALNDINVSLFQNIQRMKSDRHLSLSLLHLKNNKLNITGQHEDIIIVRANGTVEKINTEELGFYVGFIENIESFTKSIEIELYKDDLVLLHTDGITEAVNSKEEFYGFTRLYEQTIQHSKLTAYDVVHNIIADFNHFVGAKELYDDVALIAFKIR